MMAFLLVFWSLLPFSVWLFGVLILGFFFGLVYEACGMLFECLVVFCAFGFCV